jgi:recombinational DNA repair protein RecR
MEEKKEEKKKEGEEEKKHRCSICGRHSDTVICHACEDKIRAEALERKHDIEKAGKK